MYPKSGYKTITPVQIANAISSYDAEAISFRALRAYFGCFALVAIREAASRSGKKNRRAGHFLPTYKERELSRLTGSPERRIRSDLRRLKKAGLVTFSKSQIEIAPNPLSGTGALLSEMSGRRSELRPIPVPRSVIRYLASCRRPALFKLLVAYLVRGLSIDRQTGEVRGAGTVKLSWVSRVFGISERAANYARKELIEMGLISKDTGSFQRKLNRDGAYFSLNLDWAPVIGQKVPDTNSQPKCREPVEINQGEFAAPRVKTIGKFAPPCKDRKTLYRSKNQKTSGAAQKPAGVFTKQKRAGEPNIRDVQKEDLFSFSRMETLYRQAVRAGLAEASEAGALNFLAAACRAREVEGEAPKIFMGIVRKRLWKHITQADEDRALSALRKYRAEEPGRFRVAA